MTPVVARPVRKTFWSSSKVALLKLDMVIRPGPLVGVAVLHPCHFNCVHFFAAFYNLSIAVGISSALTSSTGAAMTEHPFAVFCHVSSLWLLLEAWLPTSSCLLFLPVARLGRTMSGILAVKAEQSRRFNYVVDSVTGVLLRGVFLPRPGSGAWGDDAG